MEAKIKGGRPRVTKVPALVQVTTEDEIVRSLKIIAVERGVLPSVVYRAALAEFVERHVKKSAEQ